MQIKQKKSAKKAGRPKKYNIDSKQVEKLAGYGCTNSEISDFFECSETTITRNFGENITKGKNSGKIRLRKLQWKAAEKGNITMLIWLGKQYLGQMERKELEMINPVEGIEFIDEF